MKRILFVLLAVLLCITAFSSCANDERFYLKSSKAGSWGENTHVVDVSSTQSKYDISNSCMITFSVGLGGSGNFANRAEESMWLEITAEGCLIGESEGVFEKEYSDYFEDEIYVANVKDHFWGYPDKTPNYFEELSITFPEGECKGNVKIRLYGEDEGNNEIAELTFYYASNGSVLCLSEKVIHEVSENGKPIYVDDLDNR